ncbi:hypothetical protein ACFLYU_01985 [Candidatus Dependentiae bacterium]
MFSLEIIQSIVGLVTIVLAYFLVVTISGCFRAWVAVKMGDETPAYMGFLKFSPLKHLDPFGFIFLIFLGFGWGRYIPIMPFNITGRFRKLKILIANFSDIFANLALATISLIGLIIYFGVDVLRLSLPMMFLDSLRAVDHSGIFGLVKGISSIKALLEVAYPTSSSFAISMVMITIATMYLSVLLAALNFIISGFGYVYMMFNGFTHPRRYSNNFLILLIPMFLIFFFIGPLRVCVAKGIAYIAAILAKILGFY